MIGGQYLQFLAVNFHGKTLHDAIQRENDAVAVLHSLHNPLHSGKRAGPNACPLPHLQKRVGLGVALRKPGSKCVNLTLRQRCRFATRAAHNCQNTRNLQHSNTLVPLDANKDVAGKQGKIQSDPRSVAPLALGAVEGQKMLNFPHLQLLIHTLFMARRRVGCKPFRRTGRTHTCPIREGIQDATARLIDALMPRFRQSFATLTWVRRFPHRPPDARILQTEADGPMI